MSPKRKAANQSQSTADELLQSIARSLDLLVKLKVREAQGDRKFNEMILVLHSMGCRPKDIAEALGKTPNDVNPVISRARKGGKKPKKSVKRKD